MKSLKVEFLKTDELSEETIGIINSLKNQYWKHTKKEHMKWFKENIKPNDEHLLIWGGIALLAYLNIVHVDITTDQKPIKALGIGNVCVNSEKKHMGLGAILLASSKALIKGMNSCGLLLCHDNVTDFYLKSNWNICDVKDARIIDEPFKQVVMAYDPHHILPPQIDTLIMNRSF